REAARSRGRRWTARRFAVPLVAGAATVGILAAAVTRHRARRLVPTALVAVVAAELLIFFVPVNGVIPVSEFYPTTPGHRFLEANLGDARMAGTSWAFYPNSDMVYGLHDIRGHLFHLPDYGKLLLAVDPRVFSGGSPINAQFTKDADVRSPILALLGVRYWAEGF